MSTAHEKLGRNPFEKNSARSKPNAKVHSGTAERVTPRARPRAENRATSSARGNTTVLQTLVQMGWQWIMGLIQMWITWLKSAVQSLMPA